MNCLYNDIVLYFDIKDLNALNRMLTVYFALRIDWYTNKGQINSTANKRIDVSLRSVAQRDSIGSVHKLIFNNQLAAQGDELCYKTKCFYTDLQPSQTVPMIPISYISKTLVKFVKGRTELI